MPPTLKLMVSSLLLGVLAAAPLPLRAGGQVDVYHFDTDEQRGRYNGLIAEFRCPKCLNINIAGSDAPIAKDLRRTVHRLVVQDGYSDQQVRDFLQARYGDFVLYDPPFNARTWMIWVMPFLLALVGVGVLVWHLLRRRRPAAAMNEADKARLQAVLDEVPPAS